MPDSVARRKRNLYAALAGITAALLLIGTFAWGMVAGQRADTATTNAQTLATQVKEACATGQLVVDDRNLCAKADKVAAEPAQPIAGPPGPEGRQGERGPAGPPGRDGVNGKAGSDGESGPAGEAGASGRDGAPGTAGARGVAGPPGPAGKDGQDGAQGPAGEAGPAGSPGADGVGISSVECVGEGDGSHWVVTYTNGVQQTSSGPCRLASPASEAP
jgi:hypothetical protein